MTGALKPVARTTALWVAMLVGTILSGVVVPQVRHPGIPDGPLSVFAALLVVNALGAVIVAALASRLAAYRLRKAAMLFVVVFMLETGLSWIEAVAFRQSLALTPAELGGILGAGLVRALVTASCAALLWPRAGEPVPRMAPGLLRIVAVIAIYVALYFAAGRFIAWRSEAVRDFYQGGAHIDVARLCALQIGRGILWTGLAYLLSARLRGETIVIASWTAAAFAVLMAVPLIYPSAIMPWAVREVHLVELAVSNAVFGFVAVMLLRRFQTRPGA